MASDTSPDTPADPRLTEADAERIKASVLLPQTAFPMRGNLPKREPDWLKHWEDIDLFAKLRAQATGREKFTLHDGPPYANGDLHIGHALNKILKDIINRSQQMQGKDAHYVPGWDCHGLPIEWKIEEKYRAAGKDKDAVPIVEFRKECRDFAAHWVSEQTTQFRRLGINGNWDHPYLTMHYEAEGQIVRELGKFLENGGLYAGSKPVLWSVVEKTALADAEVEYHDHKSVTIWVKFPVVSSPNAALHGASAVIWTTTTWTIPGNRAMAFNEELTYGIYQVDEVAEGSLAQVGEKLIFADELAQSIADAAKITTLTRLSDAGDLTGTLCAHPLRGQGFDHDVPLFHGDYVTADAGTGLVHIAPGHGIEDYELAHLKHGVDVPRTVDETGAYYEHVPLFAGLTVFSAPDKKGKVKDGTALGPILKAMIDAGGLLAKGKVEHSYPHSWRSKAPLIYRNTPQWFISMETNDLRDKALKSIDETAFYPAQGQRRLRSMIETRPDWCVSRQRVWGVPLPIFVSKATGEPLRDPVVIERIAAAYDAEGGDAWFTSPASRFLGNQYNADDYEQVQDVVEVWFDSGSTHAFVLEAREELKWPADLYLEGSDQHRGWFHTSLLESAGTRGRAPYDAVLTHGFTMDEQGRKMSKSLGNGIAPADVTKQWGADILRLWVVSTDYADDQRIGPTILKHTADAYRRFRNTLRFILGNLNGFSTAQAVAYDDLPEPERWVLNRLSELDGFVRDRMNSYDFHAVYQELHNFCANDLSAIYFDIRKDSLYCDGADSLTRRATQTVLAELFTCLTRWTAPFLSFTAEEAYLEQQQAEQTAGIADGLATLQSVHLEQFPDLPSAWAAPALAERWQTILDIRTVIMAALEPKRADKAIGSSLQSAPVVHLSEEAASALGDNNLADVAIVSDVTLRVGDLPDDAVRVEGVDGVAVAFASAEGSRCERCRKYTPEADDNALCARCETVMKDAA